MTLLEDSLHNKEYVKQGPHWLHIMWSNMEPRLNQEVMDIVWNYIFALRTYIIGMTTTIDWSTPNSWIHALQVFFTMEDSMLGLQVPNKVIITQIVDLHTNFPR